MWRWGCGRDSGVPDQPVSVPVGPVPTHLPLTAAKGSGCCWERWAGTGAHPQFCALLAHPVRNHIRHMLGGAGFWCRDVQGHDGQACWSCRAVGGPFHRAPTCSCTQEFCIPKCLKSLLVGFTLQMDIWRSCVTKLIGNNKQQGPNYWETLTAQPPLTLELPLLQHHQLHTAPEALLCRADLRLLASLPWSCCLLLPLGLSFLSCQHCPERHWQGELSLIYSCTVPRSADLQGAEPPVMEKDQGIDVSCM